MAKEPEDLVCTSCPDGGDQPGPRLIRVYKTAGDPPEARDAAKADDATPPLLS